MNEALASVEEHPDWGNHAGHNGRSTTWCAFCPTPEEWDEDLPISQLYESDWSKGYWQGLRHRYGVTIVVTIMGVLWGISALFPTVEHTLDLIMVVAVIVAAVLCGAVFTYLIGTTIRHAWFARRGER